MSEPRGHVLVTFSPQPSVAFFLKGVLDCAGFTVVAASSELTALEQIVEQTRPDAVVCDIGFPFLDNWKALQQACGRPALRRTPVVVTTSEVRELSRQVGETGAIELFRRPDDFSDLRAAVQSAITHGQAALREAI
jgi:CheY-like chemotaxis protein